MIKKDLSESLSFVNGSVNVVYGSLPACFPNHWHSFLEIIAPCENDMEICVDNVAYRVNERQFVLIPPRRLHSIAGAEKAPQLIIQFSNDLLPRLHDFSANRHILYLQKVIDNDDFAGRAVTPMDILLKIRDYACGDIPFKEFHLNRELLELFIMLGEFNAELNERMSAKKNLQNHGGYEKFESVARYIDEHCASKITLEDAASYAGFSKYHFSRIFKEYFETSFPEYIMRQRIKNAIEILENSNISILDAAILSGFTSHSSFNRGFKRVMHCAPSDFRRMFHSTPIG